MCFQCHYFTLTEIKNTQFVWSLILCFFSGLNKKEYVQEIIYRVLHYFIYKYFFNKTGHETGVQFVLIISLY